jgi:glutamine amidotransferase-like uncharacterized protein
VTGGSVWILAGAGACAGRNLNSADPSAASPILLFTGTGTSPGDIAAVRAVLDRNELEYSIADSSQLNRLDEPGIRRHRLLVVPGGNFIEMNRSLTPATIDRVRQAVVHGLNYLGICAGGFLAGTFRDGGFNLTSGVRFGFYSAEAQGVRKAAVAIASPGMPTIDQYWEDGPEFTGWGEVVARYPDGTPAVVEGPFGRGWVLLSGIHAEAPASWRRGLAFTTPVTDSQAYAAKLVRAALERTVLPHY